MTRSHATPNSHTATRLARLRILVSAFLNGEMMRGDMADLLQLSLSGVRSYIKDLRHVIVIDRYVDPSTYSPGEPVYRLAVTADEAMAYMDGLGVTPGALPVKPTRSELAKASSDPHRHFHILADDTHYTIRVLRNIPAHDPVHAAFFGAGQARMEART